MTARNIQADLLVDADHYRRLVQGVLLRAQHSLWIATANVKELRIEAPVGTRARAKGTYVSILDSLASLYARGCELRLLHADTPSRPFRAELAQQATLRATTRTWMRQCPRVHMKVVAVDGRELYLGSANFTGAGLGAKGEGRRNFELGVLTRDEIFLDLVQERFDRIWSGKECASCKLRRSCPEPIDALVAGSRLARKSGSSRRASPASPQQTQKTRLR